MAATVYESEIWIGRLYGRVFWKSIDRREQIRSALASVWLVIVIVFFFLPRFRQKQTTMGKAIFLNIGFVVVVIKAVTSKLSLNFLQLLYSRFLVKLSSWLKRYLFSEYWRLINLLPFYWHLVVVVVQNPSNRQIFPVVSLLMFSALEFSKQRSTVNSLIATTSRKRPPPESDRFINNRFVSIKYSFKNSLVGDHFSYIFNDRDHF